MAHDALDETMIDLPNNPEGADLSAATQFVTLEYRFKSDLTGGGGSPLALGWIVDNVELIWTDSAACAAILRNADVTSIQPVTPPLATIIPLDPVIDVWKPVAITGEIDPAPPPGPLVLYEIDDAVELHLLKVGSGGVRITFTP